MRLIRIFLLLLVVLVPWQASAQGNEPVVYGVFFYSPTCPHCHLVIQNDYPRMQAEFGDQFRLLFINVQTPGGEALFRAAYNAPHLAVNSLGVPTMIIGDVVMVGSVEIPAVAFDVIREGIAAGGIWIRDDRDVAAPGHDRGGRVRGCGGRGRAVDRGLCRGGVGGVFACCARSGGVLASTLFSSSNRLVPDGPWPSGRAAVTHRTSKPGICPSFASRSARIA